MSATLNSSFLLIFLSALGYAAATLAMKNMAGTPSIVALVLIFVFFAGAIVFEIFVLKQERLAFTYVAILGLEALLLIGISVAIGEGLSAREWAGAVLVLVGAAVLWA